MSCLGSDLSYDAMGTQESVGLETEEWEAAGLARDFEFVTDYEAGSVTRTGPDGVQTVTQLDSAARVKQVVMGTPGSGAEVLLYYYDAADRLTHAWPGNHTKIEYAYDDADRLTEIHHRVLAGQATMLKLEYEYVDDPDNPDRMIGPPEEEQVDGRPLIWRIREYEDAGLVATVTYEYDNRGRLTRETRDEDAQHGNQDREYDLAYTYDALGNRLVKTDYLAGRTTFYHYDVHEAAEAFASHNNRLQWYRVYNGVFVAEPDPVHDGLRFVYSAGGQLWLAMSYNWECDGAGVVIPESVGCNAVREFRYETGRARYLVQDRDPTTLDVIPGSAHWSDYTGEAIYADYDIVSDAADVTRMYLPGIAQMAAGAINPEYFHSDQVGTTRAMTDASYPAEVVRRASYTAFGELVDSSGGTSTRYGYVGAHGYEETLLPGCDFRHVGARWYDPATGRFLQRDRIGIDGGLNVYTYVLNVPSALVDPSGLQFCPACEANFYRKNPPPPKRKKKEEPSDVSGVEAFLSCTAWMETKAAKVATRYSAAAMRAGTAGALVGLGAGAVSGGVAGGGPGAVAGSVGMGTGGFMFGWVGGLVAEGLGDLGAWDALGWDPRFW